MIEWGDLRFCNNCREYKGIVWDEVEEEYYCIFCE